MPHIFDLLASHVPWRRTRAPNEWHRLVDPFQTCRQIIMIHLITPRKSTGEEPAMFVSHLDPSQLPTHTAFTFVVGGCWGAPSSVARDPSYVQRKSTILFDFTNRYSQPICCRFRMKAKIHGGIHGTRVVTKAIGPDHKRR